jgi:hypothetical protein
MEPNFNKHQKFISNLMLFLMFASNIGAQKVNYRSLIWDDFSYTSWNDKTAADFGWRFRTGKGWPGSHGVWSEKRISFLSDPESSTNRFMRFSSYTNGSDGDSTIQCQASKQPPVCHFGTYASRVRFRNKTSFGPDIPEEKLTQTFYMIVGIEGGYAEPSMPDSLKKFTSLLKPHSEMDFEYLPHGGWGWPATPPTLTNNSWAPEMFNHGVPGDFSGWHVLILVMDSTKASYYCDDQLLFSHVGHIPELLMSLNYNQWFIDLGTPGKGRAYEEDMDWILYIDNKFLNYKEVLQTAAELQAKKIPRLDSCTK